MTRRLLLKRGVVSLIPILAQGELAMTTDEQKLYYGTGLKNIELARAEDVTQALSNKANVAQEIPEGANLDDYTTLGDFYGYAAGGRIQNSPINDVIALSVKPMGAGLVHQTLKGPQTTLERGQHYTADGAAKVWHDWAPLATATPPQEYDLPLAAGFANGGGGTSIYWKNQLNEVHVIISVLATASVCAPTVISTLPIGYRAKRVYLFGCDIMTSTVRGGGMSLNAVPDGNIYYYGSPLVAGDVIWGYLCFVAS